MPTYKGHRCHNSGKITVTRDGQFLSPRPSMRLWNHSSEFEFGYGGSGPAQLALAMLFDTTHDSAFAMKYHQEFKWQFVAKFGDAWEMSGETITEWAKEKTKMEATNGSSIH